MEDGAQPQFEPRNPSQVDGGAIVCEVPTVCTASAMNRSLGQVRDNKIWEDVDGWEKLTEEVYWNDTATARSTPTMRNCTAP
jgi:hypothetical protein